MNKKGKPKNRPSKPQAPTSSQADDQSNPEPEKVVIEDIIELETIPVETMQEIPSDMVIIEADDDEFESPKKPKRNRAKKKREPQEVIEDIAQAVKEESKTNKETVVKCEFQAEVPKSDEIKPLSPVPIESASRKKKGKKGTQEATKDQTITESKVAPIKVESTPAVEAPTTELQEQDSKLKKKNKKGKKRTDSERSDKGEETLLCTAAFQKILQPRTDSETKKDNQRVDTAEPKPTTSIPEISKKDCKVDNKEVKDNKNDKRVTPIITDESDALIKQKKDDKASVSIKDTKDDNKHDKAKKTETKLENLDIKSQKSILSPSVAIFKEPIIIPEIKDTLIDKDFTVPHALPQKPSKEKHKGNKDCKKNYDIIKKEPVPVINKEQAEMQLDIQQPNVQASVKIVEDNSNVVPRTIETSQCSKKNKKDKKTKDITLEDKIQQVTHKENIIEPVKLADILNLLDTTTKQKIENQQKKLLTEDPVIPKSETRLEHSVIGSPQSLPIKLESSIQDSTTIKTEEFKPTDIKSDEQKSTGAKPKAKIAKPVEKCKSKSTAESSDLDVLLDTVSFESTLKSCKDNTVKSSNKSVDKKNYDEKKETTLLPEKIESIDAIINPTQIKKIDDPTIIFEECIPVSVVEKLASDVLLENIEKPLKSLKEAEAMPTQAEVSKLQCPQERSKKRKKSPKPERKPKDGLEPAATLEFIDVPKSLIDTEKEKPKVSEDVAKDEKKVEERPVTVENITDTDEELASLDKKIVTPDQIEYPRSASVQNTDRNNNMLIEEINEPLIIPIIDEVPLLEDEPSKVAVDIFKPATKDNIVTQAGFVKVEEKTKVEPKQTDLKSKVLEVNKDMEGLRLSIERSLAELSALEKCEEDIFKPNQPKIETSDKIENQQNLKMIDAPEGFQTAIPVSIPQAIETKKNEPESLGEGEKPSDKAALSTILEHLAAPPTPPQRKDNKGKNKSKKKGKQETSMQTSGQTTASSTTAVESQSPSESTQKEDKKESKTDKESKNQEKRQSDSTETSKDEPNSANPADGTSAPIEKFEYALTTSMDDVNKAFEIISNEVDRKSNDEIQRKLTENNSNEPEESKKSEDERKAKENPISQPKNFLGHPYNPVPSNKIDYKKEKNKPPNEIAAEINIKDSVEIEPKNFKASKESQTFGKEKVKRKNINETITVTNENEEYIYKYSFRNVYLSNACHLCKKDLKHSRIECSLCHLIFYCSQKHKEEDYVQHQSLCFAVSTLSHIKGTKHIYADAQNITGYNYRLLRMQTIVSCEKVLKRKLLPWEQEALLYPRMCAEPTCREWRNENLKDCSGCGQLSFCTSTPAHLPTIHQRWCASYSLYHKLVVHQLTDGRLEPRLPTKVLNVHNISDNINRLFADLFEEKIAMNEIEYASLTQLATAPLTAAYGYQLYRNKMSQAFPKQDFKKPVFTIHVIGAELQFEADSLNKWERFFLHIKPELQTLNVVLIGPELNPAGLPTHLLGKIKMCPNCRVDKKRLEFSFQDNKYYHEYCNSDEYTEPDLICAFNPSIQRASSYTQNDQWIATLNCIIKQKAPFLVTSYTMTEMQRDMNAVRKLVSQRVNVISEAKFNPFASVRPDRNFISDDEMPLLFKNYCYMVLIGAL